MKKSYCFPALPRLSSERISQLVTAFYPVVNVDPYSIKFLGGFDDYIYYVRGSLVGSSGVQEYTFKVMVENDANYYDAITKLMLHIRKEGINISVPVQTNNSSVQYTVRLKKNYVIEKELKDDVEYTGLLLTYLPGRVLPEVPQLSPRLLYNIGEFAGRLNAVLQVST